MAERIQWIKTNQMIKANEIKKLLCSVQCTIS